LGLPDPFDPFLRQSCRPESLTSCATGLIGSGGGSKLCRHCFLFFFRARADSDILPDCYVGSAVEGCPGPAFPQKAAFSLSQLRQGSLLWRWSLELPGPGSRYFEHLRLHQKSSTYIWTILNIFHRASDPCQSDRKSMRVGDWYLRSFASCWGQVGWRWLGPGPQFACANIERLPVELRFAWAWDMFGDFREIPDWFTQISRDSLCQDVLRHRVPSIWLPRQPWACRHQGLEASSTSRALKLLLPLDPAQGVDALPTKRLVQVSAELPKWSSLRREKWWWLIELRTD